MNLLLRQIRQDRWHEIENAWFGGDDIQADAVSDLRSTENKLSFWRIFADQTNLDLVITGISSGFELEDPFDFALIHEQHVVDAGFKIIPSAANTVLKEANRFHVDIIELTGNTLVKLSKIIMDCEKERYLQPQIWSLLAKGIQRKLFALDDLRTKKIRKEVEYYLNEL